MSEIVLVKVTPLLYGLHCYYYTQTHGFVIFAGRQPIRIGMIGIFKGRNLETEVMWDYAKKEQ